MAIKGAPENKVVSVFDPARGAYHEANEDDIKKQLVSFGLTEQEADERVAKLKEGK